MVNKKIRDLTVDEISRICKAHTLCHMCPLYRRMNEEQVTCLLDNPRFILEWMLDEEIEVPDELIEYTFEASHTSKEAWDGLFAYMKEHGFIYARNN